MPSDTPSSGSTHIALPRTKADTLTLIRGTLRHATVDAFESFTVGEWNRNRDAITQSLCSRFQSASQLIVRSSALGEDENGRLAGALLSECRIKSNDSDALASAIDKVAASFTRGERLATAADQILVQHYVSNVLVSGVLLTWDDWGERPYYLINYDEHRGRTDYVTAGHGGKLLHIFKALPSDQIPSKWSKLIEAAREIEAIFGDCTLDIEFAIDANQKVHIFQVRGLNSTRAGRTALIEQTAAHIAALRQDAGRLLMQSRPLGGQNTVLSDMADWNPAEMIGGHPSPLACSLYQTLITDSQWNHSRVSLGYSSVAPFPLLVTVGDKPYIDTRVCLHSLLPANIPIALRVKLVDWGLCKLTANRELHDTVEFSLAFSCYDLTFHQRRRELREHGFDDTELDTIEGCLLEFTNTLLRSSPSVISADLAAVAELQRTQLATRRKVSVDPMLLLERCRSIGIHHFTRLARFAFVGMSLLKSLVDDRNIAPGVYDALLQSVVTIPDVLHDALQQVLAGVRPLSSFLDEFGHLRPMAYNITSPRYDCMPESLWLSALPLGPARAASCDLPDVGEVDLALKNHGVSISATELFTFVRRSLEAREQAKFVFTRDLSDALEAIVQRLSALGISRVEASQIPLSKLARLLECGSNGTPTHTQNVKTTANERLLLGGSLSHVFLSSTIADEAEIVLPRPTSSEPHYITKQSVIGATARPSNDSTLDFSSVRGCVVLLEQADPGYDWIFLHSPRALITKYGGPGSHMAIRCSAYSLPAAIGCGEQLFEHLSRARIIALDCSAGTISEIA